MGLFGFKSSAELFWEDFYRKQKERENKNYKSCYPLYDKNGKVCFSDECSENELQNLKKENIFFLKKMQKIQKKILSKKIQVFSKEQIDDILLKKRIELELKQIDKNLIERKIKNLKKEIKLKNKKNFKKIKMYSEYTKLELQKKNYRFITY